MLEAFLAETRACYAAALGGADGAAPAAAFANTSERPQLFGGVEQGKEDGEQGWYEGEGAASSSGADSQAWFGGEASAGLSSDDSAAYSGADYDYRADDEAGYDSGDYNSERAGPSYVAEAAAAMARVRGAGWAAGRGLHLWPAAVPGRACDAARLQHGCCAHSS